MLAIRMQRTGRKGHAQFRMIVQDSRRTPTSGSVVATLGNYDPHSKVANLQKEKVEFYLSHGARPSDRVAKLLQREKIELPKWFKIAPEKTNGIKNLEKLRKNRPAAPAPVEAEQEPIAKIDEVAPETNEATETAEQAPEETSTSESVEENTESNEEQVKEEETEVVEENKSEPESSVSDSSEETAEASTEEQDKEIETKTSDEDSEAPTAAEPSDK